MLLFGLMEFVLDSDDGLNSVMGTETLVDQLQERLAARIFPSRKERRPITEALCL